MQLRKNAKMDLLKRVPLFSGCSRRDLERIAMIADEVDFREGKQLTREGASAREFFVILDGTAEVVRGRRKLGTLADGDFFGEIGLLMRSPRTATVTAISSVHALVITDRSFRRLLEQEPEIEQKVLQALAERLGSAVP